MKIHYNAPFNKLSYGYTAFYIFSELIKLGHDLCYYPIGPVEDCMKATAVNYYFGNKSSIEDYKNNAVSLKIWHQNEVHGSPCKAKHFGFPIFELDNFRNYEINSMNLCDEIITCSKWGAGIVEEKTNSKCSVVPLGIDRSIFKPCGQNTLEKTIFFNAGKWEKRKGHEDLIECFNNAFSKNDNVELWLMCDNPFMHINQKNEILRNIKNSNLGDKIRIIDRVDTHEQVYQIMKKVDVGVFPSRAEGWNMELLELISIGKHAIATNYSGHTEYLNASNCFLIPIDKLETAYDDIWFHGQGSWAHLGVNEISLIIEGMRALHKKKQTGSLGINNAGIETGDKFTWGNSALKLTEILSN